MTGITPRECFNLIDAAVQTQMDRLMLGGSSKRSKSREIREALCRLYQVTIEKYPQGVEVNDRFRRISKLKPGQIAELNLTSVNSMLDARIITWEDAVAPSREQGMEFDGSRAGYYTQISVRTALNIARNNFFNFPGGIFFGPLWGKANALKEVEKELESSTQYVQLHTIIEEAEEVSS